MGQRSSKPSASSPSNGSPQGYAPLLAVQSPVPDDIDIAQSVAPQHVSELPRGWSLTSPCYDAMQAHGWKCKLASSSAHEGTRVRAAGFSLHDPDLSVVHRYSWRVARIGSDYPPSALFLITLLTHRLTSPLTLSTQSLPTLLSPHIPCLQITSIAKSLGLKQDEFEMYGCHKAKVGRGYRRGSWPR